MRSGRAEAVARASLVSRGATEPAVALAAHPHRPCALRRRLTRRRLDLELRHTLGGHARGPHTRRCEAQSKPTCVAYRTDGGRRRGNARRRAQGARAEALAETQAMRFTPDAVTRVCCSDDPACAYAAAADKAGGVSLFRLLGPIHEPRDGADRARLRLRGQAPDARRGGALRGARLRLLGRRRVRRAGVRWRRGPRRALRRRGKHRRGRRGRARGERRRARGRGGGGTRDPPPRRLSKNAPRKKDAAGRADRVRRETVRRRERRGRRTSAPSPAPAPSPSRTRKSRTNPRCWSRTTT